LKAEEALIKQAGDELTGLESKPSELLGEVNHLIEGEQNNKIETADEKLSDLDIALRVLEDPINDSKNKLAQYTKMIAEAKAQEGQNDPQLMGQLKKLEKEAAGIKDLLVDTEAKGKDLKAKREEAKAVIDDAYANPDNYNTQ
jgi:chromosome segregation ATPase